MEALGAAMVGGMGCVWCVFVGGAATIGLAGTVLWIWALVDCLTKEGDEHNNRLIWTLVIVFTHAIGAIIYLLVRRPQRIKELGK
ncbi:MAG: PLD nuclease N-terminal domain-containing protein [Planctomycetota bacterium]|jgi:hypothetical protein|nr:PLD nuclease N-terminal domain-containing protein [Planctomycetota bacterium]